MIPVFRVPVGLQRPTGILAPRHVKCPWPLSPPPQLGRPSRAELLAVQRALSTVEMAAGDPVRLLLMEDLSGSMSAIAGLREAVLRGLLGWSQRNLGVDDELAVIAFGGDACIRRPPKSARDKTGLEDPDLTSYATMLGPTWQLASSFPPTEKPTLGVLISDGLVADLAGAGGEVHAAAAGVDSTALLIPSEASFAGGVPASWTAAFPHGTALVVDSQSSHLANELVGAIAALTGRPTRGVGVPTKSTTPLEREAP